MISAFQDIFKPGAQKQAEQQLREAEETMSMVRDKARACLDLETFKLYRDSYHKAEASMIEAIINYNTYFFSLPDGNLDKYAVTVMRYLTKLQAMRSLLDVVEKDARNGQQ